MTARQQVQEHGGWLWEGHPGVTEGAPGYVTPEELRKARAKAIEKLGVVPIPTEAQVLKNLELKARKPHRYHADSSGSSYDRRIRTGKLLREFGDGETCPCVYCGIRLGPSDTGPLTKMEQDHIIPFVEGGRYIMPNLVPACAGCNAARGSKPLSTIAAGWQV